jgi:competence protein ComEC
MINVYEAKSKYEKDTTILNGYIDNIKIDGNKLSILLISKEKIIINYYFQSEDEKKSFSLNLGDTIKTSGVMVEPKNSSVFNLFDYKKYLYCNNIYYTFKANNIKLTKRNDNIFYYLKQELINHIDKLGDSSSYIKALVIGDDDEFKETINDSYQINGVSHLFAISGSHITFISVILLYFLKKLKIEENKRYIIVIIFLFFYMFLTNYAGSVLRSVIFFTLLSFNKIYYFNIKTINILNLTLFILLISKPGLLYDVGFQFSYIISFYLIKYQVYISKYKGIKNLFIISLISFLGSIPICINNFFQINILSIFINIFFVPYVSFILFPLSFISLLFPFIDSIIIFFITILEHISIFLSKIKIGTIILSKPSFLIIVIYYILITIFIKGLVLKKYYYFIPILFLVIIHFNFNLFNSNIEVTFIDVGQGDSILIRLPNNKANILIDTGGKLIYEKQWQRKNRNYTIGKDVIIPYLKSSGIRKIDYLILTHGDEDHMGEAYDIISNFKIEKVILNNGTINSLESKVIKQLNKAKIYYKNIKNKDVIVIDNYKFYILNISTESNENDNSIVLYTKFNNKKILFASDISSKVESKIISEYKNIDVDILKVGHHGSKTSTSEIFLDKIKPSYAVIEVALNNRFNHPSKETIKRLNDRNINILKTSEKGTIKFIFRSNIMDIVYAKT